MTVRDPRALSARTMYDQAHSRALLCQRNSNNMSCAQLYFDATHLDMECTAINRAFEDFLRTPIGPLLRSSHLKSDNTNDASGSDHTVASQLESTSKVSMPQCNQRSSSKGGPPCKRIRIPETWSILPPNSTVWETIMLSPEKSNAR